MAKTKKYVEKAAIGGGIVGAGAGGTAGAVNLVGITAVTHSSGGIILTGSGGYIAGTLGTVGTAVTVLPAIAVAGGAVAVGCGAYFVYDWWTSRNKPE